ncbi:MAG: linear amide C-N hydrolase [Cyanobacteriota bacterium]|jgi:penicillin V acylase-like amidase (Ntn superfamily)
MKPYTTMKTVVNALVIAAMALAPWQNAQACTRLVYETGNQSYITGRSMDWMDASAKTALWVFPRGMKRDGTVGDNPIKWTSKYGSIAVSFYDAGTADGMNEKGLAANLLYLKEAEWGDASKSGKPTLSAGAWAQYFLDNFATVEEAVAAMANPAFAIIAPPLPNGHAAGLHLSLSDATGDSAILEYIKGKLVIHHGSQYRVMTNSPTFDQQLALNVYWEKVGGDSFLPGTISAADRFVRATHYLKFSPKYKDPELALASVFSQVRMVSVPLGLTDANNPNIAMTLWRTVADHRGKIYYFESAIFPAVSWIDMNKVDLSEGAAPKVVRVERGQPLAGELSAALKPAQPFQWLGAK